MKFVIKHEIRGRIRVHFLIRSMTFQQADILHYYLNSHEQVISAKIHERTCDAVIRYQGKREDILAMLRAFSYEETEVPEGVLENTGRELNAVYLEKLMSKVFFHYGRKLFLPCPLCTLYIGISAVGYIWKGLKTLAKGRLEVPVLDGTAIAVSMLRGDVDTAGSVMFLLGIGELLEEWTHKKSVGDLARTMALNVGKVWKRQEGQDVLVPVAQVEAGDLVVVHMGNVIPFDGIVAEGEAMINQASLTGESVPVRRTEGATVYAGTVVEEGEMLLQVHTLGGATRYEKIVKMIEESEKLKSGMESKAEHLADRLVPYTLAGTVLTWLLTRNVQKALSVLMVDFSCALKLAIPISVLSAIREAGGYGMTVKGGRFLEAVAEADTVVFDKTGTLTKARPVVVDVIPFGENQADEMLRIAACMEEHFPHSMAKAVVQAAKEKQLDHEEMHSKVEYIVAHGISTFIEGKKAVIGSHHFVFEDEGCRIPEGMEERFHLLPKEYSHLYLAIENQLAAVICIQDPLREEAAEVIASLKKLGVSNIVMMTGDNEHTAAGIARKIGVDGYYSEVLPEDKAAFILREKEAGRRVIMIGDGINDSPALSAADAGIAINDGAEIAREVADITIDAECLTEILTLRQLSQALVNRIGKNYRGIVGFNTLLILLGIAGLLPPAASALLHNSSTLMIGIKNMEDLLPA